MENLFKKITETRILQLVQGFRFLANFILSIILARIATQNQLQQYESITLLISTISFSVLSGISTAFLPELARNNSATNWNNSVLAALIVSCVLGIIGLGYSFVKELSWVESGLITVILVFQPVSNLLEYQLFFKRLFKQVLFWSVISAVSVVLLGGVLFEYWGVTGCLNWIAILALLRFSVVCSLLTFPIEISWVHLRYWFLCWLPLIGVTLVAGIADYMDAWLVRYIKMEEFVGYRYGARELPISTLLANGISLSYSAKLAANRSKLVLNELKEEIQQFIWLMFGITVFLMLFTKLLFTWVYGDRFIKASEIFFWYLFLCIPRGLFPQILLISYGAYQVQFWVTLIETVIHIALSWAFISYFGPVGAAFSAIISYSLEKVMLWGICRHRNWPINSIIPIKTWLITSILTIFWGIIILIFC